jgi:hypothetical protein
MRTSGVATSQLMIVITVLAGCYGGGGGGGTYTPLPAELFHGVAKGNAVAKRLVRQQAEDLALGQPVLDRAGTLGFGHVAMDIRASVGRRQLAQVGDQPLASGQGEQGPLRTEGQSGRVLSANVALGILSGIPIGDDSRIFGVDLLGGVVLASDASHGAVGVISDRELLGTHYGFRVGVLRESAALPGLAFSVIQAKGSQRSFNWSEPVHDVVGPIDVGGVTTLEVSGWNVTAGKHVGRLGFIGGVSRDTYKSEIFSNASMSAGSTDDWIGYQGTVWNWFGGASYSLGPVSLVGEWRHQRNVEDPGFATEANAIGTTRRNLFTLGMSVVR